MSEFWIEGELTPADGGEIIKGIREHLKMTQKELAEELNIAESTLKTCENGRGSHIFAVMHKICDKHELKTSVKIET